MNKSLFRAWNPSDKIMHYEGFYIDQSTGKCFYIEEAVRASDITQERQVFFYDCGEEEPILMQWIGIEDKSEKKIYKGDIVTFHKGYLDDTWTDTEQGKPFEIVWDQSSGYLGFYAKRGNHYLVPGAHSKDKKYPWQWEVIGNCFENPELLK